MLWISSLTSAAAFSRAVTKDPDMVFVSSFDGRISLTVSGASECDPAMAVIGPESEWRVNVNREGRHIKPLQIRIPKRRK